MSGGRATGQTFAFTVTVGRHTLRPSSVTHTPEPPVGVGDGVGDGAGSVGAGADDGAGSVGAGADDEPPPGSVVGCGDVVGCPVPGDATSRGPLLGRVP
jgi:hypothetical protein